MLPNTRQIGPWPAVAEQEPTSKYINSVKIKASCERRMGIGG
jgi:hypothetical protein